MNRFLQWTNLAGVLVLCAVCIAQWRSSRALNLEINALEKQRIEHTGQLAEQDRTLKRQAADLEEFRDQLSRASTELQTARTRSRDLERELGHARSEAEQLKASVAEWAEAVRLRDDRIQEANARITEAADQLKDSVTKYNALASDYNEVVGKYNDLIEQAAAPSPSNTSASKDSP